MAQLSGNSYDSTFYSLLNGALLLNGYSPNNAALENIKMFFRDEFTDAMYDTAKWMQMYPADVDSTSTGLITQVFGKTRVPVMASYTAANAEGQLITNEGVTITQESMPTAKLSLRFNQQSFEDGEMAMERFRGTPEYERIFSTFFNDTSDLIAGIQSLRTFTGLQIESTGKFVATPQNNAGGLQNLVIDFTKNAPDFDKNVQLAGNFGKLVRGWKPRGTNHDWTNENANPIGDLQDMAQFYKLYKHQDLATSVFRLSIEDAALLYNHPSTKLAIYSRRYGTVTELALAGFYPTNGEVNQYLTQVLQLPPIQEENGYGAVQALDPVTQKMTKISIPGFESGRVLLRPAGACGHYSWKSPTNMFSTSVNPMFISDGGRIGIQQMINTLGKEMFFNAESRGITVPDNIDLWLYCDIATSQEETT